jgi:hypothetical protein
MQDMPDYMSTFENRASHVTAPKWQPTSPSQLRSSRCGGSSLSAPRSPRDFTISAPHFLGLPLSTWSYWSRYMKCQSAAFSRNALHRRGYCAQPTLIAVTTWYTKANLSFCSTHLWWYSRVCEHMRVGPLWEVYLVTCVTMIYV